MASMQTTELLVPYAAPGDTYTVSILLPILGIIFVGLRIYTRVLQKTPLGVDDLLVLSALVRNIPASLSSDVTDGSHSSRPLLLAWA